jgi:hypothetical protein
MNKQSTDIFHVEIFNLKKLDKAESKEKYTADVSHRFAAFGDGVQSLTLTKEHRLRVSENRVLRIFGPKRDGVMGWWRKLHNEELHNLYSSLSIIRIIKSRRMRWGRKGTCIGYW